MPFYVAAWHIASVKFRASRLISKVQLNFTKDKGPGLTPEWQTLPATLEIEKRRVVASLPVGTVTCCFNLINEKA
jgi:hypothetical protein